MAMDFVAHLLMLHGLHPVFDEGGGNGVYWTLAREEYFYLMYFGLMMVRRRWGAVSAVASTLAVGLAFPPLMQLVLSPASPYWGVVSSSALVLWVQWALGMLAAEAYVGIIRVPRVFSTGWTIPLWAGAAYAGDHFRSPLAPLLWGLVFFTALNACVAAETGGRWSSDRFTTWLAGVGVFSYSLYLVHNPVRMVVNQLFVRIPAPNGGLLFLALAGVIAAAGFGAARIFFALVERRFLVFPGQPHSGVKATPIPVLAEP
jgi:peptidoglycan/LPS O-acetylase OafA/YrhL